MKEGAVFCAACGKPVNKTAAGAGHGGMSAASPMTGNKGKKIWFVAIPALLVVLGVILFLVFRGGTGGTAGDDNAFSPYQGTWTQSMDNGAISMYIDQGRGYNTLEVNDKSVIFRGQYQEFLNFEGMSTEKFEMPIKEFEYYGNSGVKYLDTRNEYVKKTDEFIPVVSYEYYYHSIHDLGLAFCTLSNGDTVICLLINSQNFENTIDGIGTISSYKSTIHPEEWIYAVTFSQ
ncbi:MAG: hypothetical protein IK016_00380 [Lachnospiraceae bacterium]|nr:hypothetical protein [Lachnospiraceae bacterium]